ncbi:MAG: helix-turn-helix transcriptional regulator [Clostridia bacterium]|nr:helix-turn-helix transcriptional regulator [Clostridia bacterium]
MIFRLKELRASRKISQLKLALDLNMNQNSISRYENLEREADYNTLIKFADYFGVSLDYLLGRTNVPSMNESTSNKTTR